jgi:hypothetical protein
MLVAQTETPILAALLAPQDLGKVAVDPHSLTAPIFPQETRIPRNGIPLTDVPQKTEYIIPLNLCHNGSFKRVAGGAEDEQR